MSRQAASLGLRVAIEKASSFWNALAQIFTQPLPALHDRITAEPEAFGHDLMGESFQPAPDDQIPISLIEACDDAAQLRKGLIGADPARDGGRVVSNLRKGERRRRSSTPTRMVTHELDEEIAGNAEDPCAEIAPCRIKGAKPSEGPAPHFLEEVFDRYAIPEGA